MKNHNHNRGVCITETVTLNTMPITVLAPIITNVAVLRSANGIFRAVATPSNKAIQIKTKGDWVRLLRYMSLHICLRIFITINVYACAAPAPKLSGIEPCGAL